MREGLDYFVRVFFVLLFVTVFVFPIVTISSCVNLKKYRRENAALKEKIEQVEKENSPACPMCGVKP